MIILDEPTAHLDLPNRVAIVRLLRSLVRHTGKSVLLSTHELDLALLGCRYSMAHDAQPVYAVRCS